MTRLLLCAVLGLAVGAGGAPAAPAKAVKDEKKSGKAAKDDKKAGKEVAGTMVALDPKKGTVTIKTEEDKSHTFVIANDTEIVGPRGGKSRLRLKDDRFSAGSTLKVVPGADGKAAKITFGYRKRKPKPKDKDKE